MKGYTYSKRRPCTVVSNGARDSSAIVSELCAILAPFKAVNDYKRGTSNRAAMRVANALRRNPDWIGGKA